MEEPQKHVVVVQEVELLGVTAGRVGGQPVAILSLRFDPSRSFAPNNIAVAKEQAVRLVEDLIVLFETSDALKEQE